MFQLVNRNYIFRLLGHIISNSYFIYSQFLSVPIMSDFYSCNENSLEPFYLNLILEFDKCKTWPGCPEGSNWRGYELISKRCLDLKSPEKQNTTGLTSGRGYFIISVLTKQKRINYGRIFHRKKGPIFWGEVGFSEVIYKCPRKIFSPRGFHYKNRFSFKEM